MKNLTASALVLSVATLTAVGCNASGKIKFDIGGGENNNGGGSQIGSGGASAGEGGDTGESGSPGLIDPGNIGGGGNVCTGTEPDSDGDGFTVEDGDCNDCDANANPGAIDVAGNDVDEDCNGTADDAITTCDDEIMDYAASDAMMAAKALGLCHTTTETEQTWGVIDAKFVKADGSPGMDPRQAGVPDHFGKLLPTEGKRMLVLSSGTARNPDETGYESPSGADMGTTSSSPPGFPVDSPACPGTYTSSDTIAKDPAGLEVKLRVPTNAKSFSFNFNFYTYEFPTFICDEYNDFFVALQSPAPANAQSGNISFDAQGNPVSVNNGFLEVCEAQNAGGKQFNCSQGSAELQGTGFEGHAATGWLQTVSPVEPGAIVTLRFAVFDVGDHNLDSTVIMDKLQFSGEEATEAETQPVPK